MEAISASCSMVMLATSQVIKRHQIPLFSFEEKIPGTAFGRNKLMRAFDQIVISN